MTKYLLLSVFAFTIFTSCDSDPDVDVNEPNLIVKLDVDSDQVRLGNLGEEKGIAVGNAGQNPVFNTLSAHYLEMTTSPFTFLGEGEVLYKAPETTTGGELAIDFNQATLVEPGEVFLKIPLKDVTPGLYDWVRLSLSYQNFDIDFQFNDIPLTGTIASFVGFNSYIENYQLKDEVVEVNANKKQGYWGFETLSQVTTGQAPEGATTVPNPLFASSPIPQGSCVVTGQFGEKLEITGTETQNIEVTLSLSVNKSFEWVDENGNGKWDVSSSGVESVVDMGLRGLVPSYEK